MSEERRRYIVPGYVWAYMQRRRYYLAIMALLAAVVMILLRVSSSLPDYGTNLSLNVAADLIGTIVVLFVIAPFIERAALRRESVLERFDHGAFIRQAADARRRILTLLWPVKASSRSRDPPASLQAKAKRKKRRRLRRQLLLWSPRRVRGRPSGLKG